MIVVCVLCTIMNSFAMIQDNIREYGQIFILLRRTSNNGYDSSLLQWIWVLFPLGIAYIEYILLLDILV